MDWGLRKFKNNCIISLPANIFSDDILNELKELLKDLSENDYQTFYLDMSQTSKVNSKNLATIINLYQFAHMYDMQIKLYNLQPYVSQLIYQTRLNQIFDICDPDASILGKPATNKLMSA